MLVLGHAGLTLGAAYIARRLIRGRNPGGLDPRILFIGAFLPDILDKPLGMWLFRDTFGSGRIFGHSLLFNLLLLTAGLYLFRKRRELRLLTLGGAALLHLVFDRMWLDLRTLLWPALGLAFPRADLGDWLYRLLEALRSDPGVYIPESVGGVILLWFGIGLVRRGKLREFLLKGRPLNS